MEYEETIAQKVLYHALVMEACERVLWGKVLPETDAAMAELKSTLKSIAGEREQKAREEEEKKAQQQAERERERLERLAATKPAIPQTQPLHIDSPHWQNYVMMTID
jgi:septal ring factor EnvC (AmiA/AmiB activator)